MGKNTALDRPTFMVGETQLCSVSFDDKLDSGESLSGTPTVAEVSTSDLTFANEAVSTSALTINHKSVAAGRAVQFKVTEFGTTNAPYTVRITCATDSTPARTVKGEVVFEVEA